MKNPKVAVVIPTIRNLDFLKAWKNEFQDCIGIIVEDHPQTKITTPKKYFKKTFHYNWSDIDKQLGRNAWIISRKNAGIRSFGFLKAYQIGCDVIITLDDDCYPVKKESFLATHLDNLSTKAPKDWSPTYPHRNYYGTRGFPYKVRNKKEVVISHGLWSNILDFDGQTQLKKLNNGKEPVLNNNLLEFIPENYFFPMCSMNLAFKTKITPIMYFPPMGYDNNGKKWGYDRFDDIWAGIFAKKVIDNLNYSVVNGSPFVVHRKASDVFENIKKEAAGIKTNETLFEKVKNTKLNNKAIKSSYLELFNKVDLPKEVYFAKLKKAARIWVDLFK